MSIDLSLLVLTLSLLLVSQESTAYDACPWMSLVPGVTIHPVSEYSPTKRRNPFNIVHDNRLRILAAPQNYCTYNGILMVGSQVQQCCDFKSPDGLPNISPAPTHLIGTARSCDSSSNGPPLFTSSATNSMDIAKDIAALNELGSNNTTLKAPILDPTAGPQIASGAASAGSVIPSPPKAGGGGGGVPNSQTPTGAGGAAGGGPRGSGNSGIFGGNLNDTTGTTTPTSGVGFEGSAAALDSMGATYSKGGGSGPRGNGGGASNKSRGSSITGGATQSLNFGVGPNGEQILIIEDPENYFTRINLDDSLFKVIRKRYQTKENMFLPNTNIEIRK